jgi:hypothetical protein
VLWKASPKALFSTTGSQKRYFLEKYTGRRAAFNPYAVFFRTLGAKNSVIFCKKAKFCVDIGNII